MPRHQDYPDQVSYRRRSVLPPGLQTDIIKLSKAVQRNKNVHKRLSAYLSGIKALPAATVARAATEIQAAADPWRWWYEANRFWVYLGIAREPTLKAQIAALTKYPALSHLYIFHGDGHLREAALKCMIEPPDSPFVFAAVTYRLNDWVEQVRDAAYECASRLFPKASANTVADASFFLFTQIQHLGRWGARERQILESALYRRDVMEALTFLLMQRPTGRVATVMRYALSKHGLDHALPRLARMASLPHVRAIAYETLIFRRAQWVVGHQHEWIDKSYGNRRRVPRFDRRTVNHYLNIENLIADAARDRAVAVRKISARGLIDLRHELSSEMTEIGRLLSEDKSSSVRSRAQFYLKNLPDI